jgi:O-antigen/teichoic acid export membrane protein
MVFKSGLRQLLYINLAFHVLLAALSGFIILRRYRYAGFALNRTIFSETLTLGVKTHFGNIAHFIFHRVDYFLIHYLIGSQAVGFYGLATSMAESVWMAVGSLYTVTLARISGSPLKESIDLVSKVLRNIVSLLSLLAFGLTLSGYFLIKFLYGLDFLPAYVPMLLLLPGVIFFGASWFLGLFFIGHQRKPEITTVIAWAGLAISLPLYVALIKLIGISGAAIASSATYCLIFLTTFLCFKRVSGKSLSEALVMKKADFREIYEGLQGICYRKKCAGEQSGGN